MKHKTQARTDSLWVRVGSGRVSGMLWYCLEWNFTNECVLFNTVVRYTPLSICGVGTQTNTVGLTCLQIGLPFGPVLISCGHVSTRGPFQITTRIQFYTFTQFKYIHDAICMQCGLVVTYVLDRSTHSCIQVF